VDLEGVVVEVSQVEILLQETTLALVVAVVVRRTTLHEVVQDLQE
jgi:hypothetical protein